MSKEDQVRTILTKHMASEEERMTDMLASIRAIHGENPYQAVKASFESFMQTNMVIEMLAHVADMDADLIEDMIETMLDAEGEKTRVLFHLAMGAPIGDCNELACHCDPRANELKKMYLAMMNIHLTEKARAEDAVSSLLSRDE
jgi:hypothetical protein